MSWLNNGTLCFTDTIYLDEEEKVMDPNDTANVDLTDFAYKQIIS